MKTVNVHPRPAYGYGAFDGREARLRVLVDFLVS